MKPTPYTAILTCFYLRKCQSCFYLLVAPSFKIKHDGLSLIICPPTSVKKIGIILRSRCDPCLRFSAVCLSSAIATISSARSVLLFLRGFGNPCGHPESTRKELPHPCSLAHPARVLRLSTGDLRLSEAGPCPGRGSYVSRLQRCSPQSSYAPPPGYKGIADCCRMLMCGIFAL